METIQYLVFIYGSLTCTFFVTVHGINGCPNETDTALIQWIADQKDYPDSLYRGEWWKVDCRVKNYVNVTARLWQKKTSSREKIIAEGRKLKRDGNIFNLTGFSSSDAGDYYCVVCDKKRKAGTVKILKEGKPFQYPVIISKPSGTIEFGADVSMACEVAGSYILKWFKGGERLLKGTTFNNDKKNYKRCLTLEIKKFKKTNEGLYICRAERKYINWITEEKVLLNMTVLTKPTFLNFSNGSETVIAGEEFSLAIVADGSPKPRVYCSLERTKDKQMIFKNMSNSVTLRITTLSYSRDNNATFTCKATNINGYIVVRFILNVLVKPKIKKDGSAQMKTVVFNGSTPLNLTCNIDEANPPPQIHWKYSYQNGNNNTWFPVPSADVNSEFLTLKSQTKTKVYYKCVASNSRGEDFFIWSVHRVIGEKGKNVSSYVISIIVVSIIIGFFLLLIIVVLYKRKKLYGGFYIFTLPPARDYIKTLDQSKSLQEQSHKLPYLLEWEFPRANISLLNELGSGAFGTVYLTNTIGITSFSPRTLVSEKKTQRRFSFSRFQRRNVYINLDKIVKKTAVKTLKENYDPAALADIHSEIRILIHIGEHENVVNILGACTKGYDKPLLILEYCPHGNLRDFLRNRRDIYVPEWKEIDNTQLTITDLVNFAVQVSNGMEFLISRKCIHRDLAARNVLVGEGFVAKISDFGLARDVYESLEYTKRSSGLLPLKWMAIESIKDRIFNEKTDVWSFGILLWEMFSLGGMPYPKVQIPDLFEFLINGNRMDPPICCPEEIGDIMMNCWCENPDERQQFSSITGMLEKLCSKKTEKTGNEYQNIPSDVADEDDLGIHAY